MQQFIPLEDDWDALDRLRPDQLIPYRVGLLRVPGPVQQPRAGGSGLVLNALPESASATEPALAGHAAA